MKNAALLFAFGATLFFAQTGFADCPNMNGQYTHTQLFVHADLTVTQTACDSMTVHMKVKAPGNNVDETIQSQLDGVTRDVPSDKVDERDTVTGSFQGDTVVFVMETYVTDSQNNVTHTSSTIKGTMSNANTIVLNYEGSNYSFKRN